MPLYHIIRANYSSKLSDDSMCSEHMNAVTKKQATSATIQHIMPKNHEANFKKTTVIAIGERCRSCITLESIETEQRNKINRRDTHYICI